MIPFQSQALQDRFVMKILNKQDGFFVDIGSCHAVSANNSYALESIGWNGICVELNSEHNDSYVVRHCKYINEDATIIDYEELLKDAPVVIDYLSIDVDEQSTEVLKKIPFGSHQFRIVTIEHDAYIHSDKYRHEQRIFLHNKGYTLMCANVLVPVTHDTFPGSQFEDWWCKKDLIDDKYRDVLFNECYPQQIIDKL